MENDSIRVQASVSNVTTGATSVAILLVNNVSLKFNKAYTYGSIGNSCTANSFSFSSYMDGQIVYNRNTAINSDPEPIVQVKTVTGLPFIIVCSINDINASNPSGNVDITFKPCFLYEGEFKNPPVMTSLDVKPGNQFAYTDLENVSISPVQNTSLSTGWYDLGVIRYNHGVSYMRLFVWAHGTSLYPQEYVLEAAVSGYNSDLYSTYLTAKVISGRFSSINNNSLFTKFRLGQSRSDSAGYLCIQGYHSSTVINKVSVLVDHLNTAEYMRANGNKWITTIKPSTTDIVSGTSEIVPTIEMHVTGS